MNEELQQAIYAVLTADTSGPYPVYDAVPRDAAMPYLTIGEATLTKYATDESSGYEAVVTIHAWSKYAGRKEAEEMLDYVRGLLDRSSLDITGFIGCSFEQAQNFLDQDGTSRHGVIQFRVLVLP
jgi:Protein of unknown function (DUF3168)